MRKIILLAAMAAFSSAAFSQTPTPTPTPPAQSTARASYTELIPASSLASFVAGIPANYTAADGTVLTLQGYTVRVISTGPNAGKDAVTLSYQN